MFCTCVQVGVDSLANLNIVNCKHSFNVSVKLQHSLNVLVNCNTASMPLSIATQLQCLCQPQRSLNASVNCNTASMSLSTAAQLQCLCQLQHSHKVFVNRNAASMSLSSAAQLQCLR